MPERTYDDTCAGCGRRVVWAVNNRTQKRAPIDFEPPTEGKGNIALDFKTRTYDVLNVVDQIAARARGEALLVSHFVTCKERDKFRKKK